jgi:hypothetical protein
MDIMSFLWGMKWELLKNKLLSAGISPNDIQWVDFNNINDLNRLAEKIVPNMIKSNPMIANVIKQNASMLWADKQKEVVDVIDSTARMVE